MGGPAPEVGPFSSDASFPDADQESGDGDGSTAADGSSGDADLDEIGDGCAPTGDTLCVEGVTYWVDDCGGLRDVAEACPCGCADDGLACRSPCECIPRCDERECGSDGCGGTCAPGCSGEEVCREEAGQCVACIDAGQCDDGLYCNGPERCIDFECVHEGSPCGPGELCDESSDSCALPAWEDLLDGRLGFGGEALGGAGGELCRVTNLDDHGPGSLRECAEGPGPRWIRFDVSGTLRLDDDIDVASYITIDGRGRRVTITDHGLSIVGESHVIIHNLTLTDGGDGDAIHISREASNIWIDHLSLSSYGDGLVDITRAATDVTVSWCRFDDHNKVMLIGASVSHTDDVDIRVTLHHNYFNQTVQRHPRLRFGRVHAFNNYLRRWQGYGMASCMDGELLSEHNIFEAGSSRRGVIAITGDDPQWGDIESRREWQLNGAIVQEHDTESVFEASDFYDYDLVDADEDLRDTIRDHAGWQDVPFPG